MEVPPELEEIFADAGAALFPRSVRDLGQRCSCPDQQVPRKHPAATFYLLAEEFDADPFLILRWRGRDRDALLGRLRALRSAAGANDSRAPADRAVDVQVTAGAALALAGLSEPPDDAAGGASVVDRFLLLAAAAAATGRVARRCRPSAAPIAAARRHPGR